jgi:hypothetical protein
MPSGAAAWPVVRFNPLPLLGYEVDTFSTAVLPFTAHQ